MLLLTSTNTGVTPVIRIASAVAGNVKDGQTTKSPLPIFKDNKDSISASVPLAHETQYLAGIVF